MMKRFGKETFRNMPWKNGGGATTELFRLPDVNGGDFLLRISIARVESNGPFSFFPGFDRHLLILKGEGCVLNHTTRLTQDSPSFDFPGELKIDCELINGKIQDFNVMIKRTWGKASVERIALTEFSEAGYIYLRNSEELLVLESGENAKFPEQECIVIRTYLTV